MILCFVFIILLIILLVIYSACKISHDCSELEEYQEVINRQKKQDN